jgi:hypothetical protein
MFQARGAHAARGPAYRQQGYLQILKNRPRAVVRRPESFVFAITQQGGDRFARVDS